MADARPIYGAAQIGQDCWESLFASPFRTTFALLLLVVSPDLFFFLTFLFFFLLLFSLRSFEMSGRTVLRASTAQSRGIYRTDARTVMTY